MNAGTMTSEPLGPSFVHTAITDWSGHQAAYQRLLMSLFDLEPSSGEIGLAKFRALVRAEKLLFSTLDDQLFGFVAVGVARAMLGRPTVGLFLRPNSCALPGWKSRVKRKLFQCLVRVPRLSIISVLPDHVFPGIGDVATATVHDPQLWDIVDSPIPADREAVKQLNAAAAGRPILAFLGWATAAKGFAFLAEIVESHPAIMDGLLVVVAGKIPPDMTDSADRIARAGGLVWNRFATEGELAALYETSALVWNCYAPGYDQASAFLVGRCNWAAARSFATTRLPWVPMLES